MTHDSAWIADFHWLTPQLAVGGSFPVERVGDLAKDHGISAVVDLRGEDCDDAAALRAAGLDLLHLPTPDLEPATVEMLDRGVEYVRSEMANGGKVLIHCRHGIGRSALLALCVLVDAGWEPLAALAHAKNRRERISPSPSQYQGWARWLQSRSVPVPDAHSFGCIAYRHLARR